MPKYITRIELLDAEDRDYEKLDIEFSKKDFKRAKKSGEKSGLGMSGRLKEYYKEGNHSLQQITASVYNSAKKIGKKFSFTVMRDKGYFPIPGK
jgi:hypothetical protein